MNKYLVLGMGRSGSNWIADAILNLTGGARYHSLEDWQIGGAGAVFHSHAVQDLLTAMAWATGSYTSVIISRRENLFHQTMSTIMAEHTGEFYHYSDQPFETTTVDREIFRSRMRSIAEEQATLEHQPCLAGFARVIRISFEQMIQQSSVEEFLADRLQIAPAISHKVPLGKNQSPRRYQDLCANYRSLADEFDRPDLITAEWSQVNMKDLIYG